MTRSRQILLILSVCLVTGMSPCAWAGADIDKLKTADELWYHLAKLQQGPATQPQTPEEAMKIFGDLLREAEVVAKKFIDLYPEDPRRWEVKIVRAQALGMLATLEERQQDLKQIMPILSEIINGKDVPVPIELEAYRYLIEIHVVLGSSEAKAFLEKAAKHDNPHLAEFARQRLEFLKVQQSPLDLKFTALNGDKVDLAKLRGKVVLIDFWATWCGPCLMDMPHVLKAYNDYRDQGFEIIGVSLDDDKTRLLAYLKEHGVSWPQHFDGKGFETPLIRRFGINGIPTQWLLDKKGLLRDANAQGTLAQKIPELLAE